MTIIRRNRSENYTIIPNYIMEDDIMSFEARGLLCYLLTRPHDWTVRTKHLQGVTGYGRDKCQKLVTELVERGYAKRETSHDEAGKFTGQELIIYDEMQLLEPEPDFQLDGNRKPDLPEPDFTADGKHGPLISNNSILSTDISKSETKVSSRKRGTRLPVLWRTNEDLQMFASDEGLNSEQIQREIDKFRDYWHSLAGAKAVKLDWDKTFKNWIRRAAESLPANKPQNKSFGDVAKRMADEYRSQGR